MASDVPLAAVDAVMPAALTTDSMRQHNIAREIGQQVEQMILQAKQASESRVSKEIQKAKMKMDQMGEKIKTIGERVNSLDPSSGGGFLKSELERSIAKLEEVWEGEVGSLKHELWQTIQAHNHNADLLKHHKDAIDSMQGRIGEAASNPELQQIQHQLNQVDTIAQREQANQAQLDQFVARLTAVQQQFTLVQTAGTPGTSPWGAAALPFGAGASPWGAPPVSAKPKAKKPKAKTKPMSKQAPEFAGFNANAPEFTGFNANAAEFVPTWGGSADGGE